MDDNRLTVAATVFLMLSKLLSDRKVCLFLQCLVRVSAVEKRRNHRIFLIGA